ncbi:MAG TPA: DUF1624 domain-containing protein [Clostridiaceae bacterium]|nr:DUF1624 domain-containing protein [Clostridiaceae bacterium]
MENKKSANRIWELDFLRGIALLLMIYFHVIYDLKDMWDYPVSYSSGINYYIGKLSAILFMIISGISCSLSRSNLKRGLKVFGIAMAITIVTHLYGSEFGIKFGILHFLGICMMMYPLFGKLKWYLLVLLGTAMIIAGLLLDGVSVNFDFLFPIGITSPNFSSSDYYPLLPWMGVFLYGNALAKILYAKKTSLFRFSIKPNIISWLGRNTLLIYVVHQPVIIAVIYIIRAVF